MIPFSLLLRWAQICSLLFSSVAIAALQNVTVDDAVLTGAGVPQYLPNNSVWALGNTCSGCFVHPDPSLAYDGTWHDTTYNSSNGFTQAIEFSFTGSALYIFFIIANTVPGASTLTAVNFILDSVNVSSYTHSPDSSTDYLYNVSVYANVSLESRQHTMMIQPINSGPGINVLILFDYYVYSTEISNNISTSSLSQASSTTIPTPSTRQREPTGAIIGGTVGGVAFLALLVVFLLCFRRYKNPGGVQPPVGGEPLVDPYNVEAREDQALPPSIMTQNKLVASSTTNPQPSIPSASTPLPPENDPPLANEAVPPIEDGGAQVALLREVRGLRAELARLQPIPDSNQNVLELLPEEAPPEYS